MAYNLRECCEKNYKDMCNPRLLRAERTRHDSERLFPLEVLERDGARVKVHYVGYNSTKPWLYVSRPSTYKTISLPHTGNFDIKSNWP